MACTGVYIQVSYYSRIGKCSASRIVMLINFNTHPILFRFIAFLLLPLLLLISAFFFYLNKSLPSTHETLIVEGVGASVEIIRDSNHIPHIFASSDQDAFFGLGFAHAQDRMWQMEYSRRFGQGRLAEIVGVQALQSDKFMRTLGLYGSAKEAWNSLSVVTQNNLSAYSAGINAWLKSQTVLPIEFILLGVSPESWKPEDSLLQVKLMALDLGQNFSSELIFDLLIKELGLEKAVQLMSGYSVDDITTREASQKLEALMLKQLISVENQIRGRKAGSSDSIGSNAWVISGKHSDSGMPILAADPHLLNQIPSVWYLAEIQGNEIHVTGATVPGVPFVIIGRNSKIAWGETNLTADVQDLFVERINPLNDNEYELNGNWLEMDIQIERINVKTNFPAFLNDPIPSLEWPVRRTRHGPLISDVLGQYGYPVALQWTALDSNDTTMESLRRINYATDWHTFKSSISMHIAPALNYIYADITGNIAYKAAGKIPVRRDGSGKLPVPGWNELFDWDGYIPFDILPSTLNPVSGVIINSNNKVHGPDYPYVISNNWSPPYRADRIAQLINSLTRNKKISAADFSNLQGDTFSLQTKRPIKFLKHLQPSTEKQAQALELIAAWDGNVTKASEAAAIYQSWLRNFNRRIIADDLRGGVLHEKRGDLLQDFVDQLHPVFIDNLLDPSRQDHVHWCDQNHTDILESCAALALIALDDAISELERFAGANAAWGDVHKAHYRHNIFSNIQLLDVIFDRNIASSGDGFTVNVAGWSYSKDKGYRQVIGPTYRQVIDLGNWDRSGFINNTGQSGNILSKHYDDFIELHGHMKLLPMSFGRDGIKGKGSIMILSP